MGSDSGTLTSDTLPELQPENTRTQRDINWIIKYLRKLAMALKGIDGDEAIPEIPSVDTTPGYYLPTNDPLTLARQTPQERYEGIRWWLEEADRQDQDRMPEYARAIRLALIEQMYKWESEA